MIHPEKKILKSLTRLTKNATDIIYCDQCNHKFILVHDVTTKEKSAPFSEKNITALLKQLADKDYINITQDSPDIYFTLTINAIYRFQISFDRIRHAFFSKFIYGLISGIIIGVASTIIAEYLMIELGLKTVTAGYLMGLSSLNIWQ